MAANSKKIETSALFQSWSASSMLSESDSSPRSDSIELANEFPNARHDFCCYTLQQRHPRDKSSVAARPHRSDLILYEGPASFPSQQKPRSRSYHTLSRHGGLEVPGKLLHHAFRQQVEINKPSPVFHTGSKKDTGMDFTRIRHG